MGIAASLFFSTYNPEHTLDWRIRPSEEQFDAQEARWNHLAEYLLTELAQDSACSMRSWLQGSYKFGTQVRPARPGQEFDIDLGVYFQWPGQPHDGAHSPVDLKDMVQACLLSYAANSDNDATSVAPPKPRCARIHFAGDFHIDVPGYHLDASRDARALATAYDEWEASDPKAIYQWWTRTVDEAARPRARRMVRYLKMWAALNFEDGGRPSSILLTVLAGEAYVRLDLDSLRGDDEVFQALIASVLARLQRSYVVPNPADRSEDLNRLNKEGNEALVEQLYSLLGCCGRALTALNSAESAEIWSEAFAHFFPIPGDEEVLEEIAKSSSRALVAQTFEPQVSVRAVTDGLLRQSYSGQNGIGPIPKDCTVTFALANAHALPAGAVVSWTVRNEGDEAEFVNDLGHLAGYGESVSRHSAYNGLHHMDVSVKLNGRLIGRRRIPVNIRGNAPLLPRFKQGRPANIKLRGRR